MAGEYSSGARLEVGSRIRGYEVQRVFDPGQFASASVALARDGSRVFLKKYKKPGMYSPWYDAFVAHQREVRRRIAAHGVARSLCDDFVECFSHESSGSAGRKRAIYAVYGLIEGGLDLAAHLRSAPSEGEAEFSRRLILARVLVAALGAVHGAGLVHADLKPDNVMLIPDGSIRSGFRLRLIDFDFSLLQGADAPWKREINVGTPGFWSPEHLRNEVPVPASDIFTCGIMLTQLLSGRHPCEADPGCYDDLAVRGGWPAPDLSRVGPSLADVDRLSRAIIAALRGS